ncbi:MAG TPA: Gfo/Idh/MocA family oxidoreductase [Spirochaetia bacterium]|nr:Gfo/Idh/MocA family oxidoreductase [Spirochaetia bacterium]
MDDTYGSTPPRKALELGDVYGVAPDAERSARRPLSIGFIGAGPVVQSKHWPAIKRLQTIWEPVSVTAFALRTAEQARKVESVFGGRWYPDYRRMLEDEKLDGVIVCSSDDVHCEHTCACLERGIPVLVEKPIARSLRDSLRMCSLADSKHVPLMTVANKRYSPPYRRAKKLVTEGPVSNPAMAVAKFNLGYDYVDLFESGTIHIFDMVRYLMGDVSSVRCVGLDRYHRNRRRFPVDNAVCQLEFTSGAVGAVSTSSTALSFKPWERIEIYGDHAWLDVDDQCRLTLHDSELEGSRVWAPVVPNTLMFDEEFGGFMGMIENFLQCIRGTERPLATGWDGHRAYEVLVASEVSLARGGAVVRLPLDPADADAEAHSWLASHGWPGTRKE